MPQADLNKNVLVTGATGFVGHNLVEALLQKGYSVTCLVRKTSDTRALQRQHVRLVAGDLTDPQAVRQAARGVFAACHLAGVIKAANREDYYRVNQGGTRILLEALAEANPGLNRFIHVSSLAAAGPSNNDRGLTEDRVDVGGERRSPLRLVRRGVVVGHGQVLVCLVVSGRDAHSVQDPS